MTPSPRRALFLVNSHARRGRQPLDAIRETLRAGGIALAERPWQGAAHACALIRAEGATFDLAIVGGGDGTLNALAAVLAECRLPLGIVPLGTANDFARTLGLPLDPETAARLICESAPHPFDLGMVNGHAFLNVAHIGFGASLARALTARAKQRFGILGYGVVAARLLGHASLFTAHIAHDGGEEAVRTVQVAVGNGRHYGGGLTIAPDASAVDGHLDVLSLEVAHWWHLLPLLPALRHGPRPDWREVRTFRTTALTVRTRTPRPVATDGEIVTKTPAAFSVRPGALLVHAPASPPSGMAGASWPQAGRASASATPVTPDSF